MSISNSTCPTLHLLRLRQPVDPNPMGTQNYTPVPPSNPIVEHQAGHIRKKLPSLANLLTTVSRYREAANKPCDFLTRMKQDLCAKEYRCAVASAKVASAKKFLEKQFPPEHLRELAQCRKKWDDLAKKSNINKSRHQFSGKLHSKSFNQMVVLCNIKS